MGGLRTLFPQYAVVQILDFLSLYDGFEYTKSDIARETGISRRTLYEVWPLLQRLNLVRKTRSVGNASLYTLNSENPVARMLDELNREIAIYMAKQGITSEGLPQVPVVQQGELTGNVSLKLKKLERLKD